MSKNISVNHKIQNEIIDYLFQHVSGRFRDLRTKGVDTNLLTYHLNKLVNLELVEKIGAYYRLSLSGLEYADRKADETPRIKTIIMFLIQNSDGDVLIEQLTRHPFMGTWTLPCGQLQPDDRDLLSVARRLIKDKFDLKIETMHVGTFYIHVRDQNQSQLTTLVHMFKFNTDDIKPVLPLAWARPHKLGQYHLAPAVEAIVARGFFQDPFFFEEFEADWYNEAV